MSSAVMPASRSVTALAKVETIRLAKHPFFIIGVVLCAIVLRDLGPDFDYYNVAIAPGFFIGVFSMIATFRLARSMEKVQEAVGSTPAGVQDRIRGLQLACLLPAALGILAFVWILAFQEPSEPIAYGAWSEADRFAIFFGEIVMACLGGPLLGIAVARWWRFPGAVVALVASILFVVLLGEGLADGQPQARWAAFIRLLSPWTQFTTVDTDSRQVGTWLGSPGWWLGWVVALTVLAVLGALLKGAEGAERQRLFRAGLVTGLVGLVFLGLAVFMGPDEATLHAPSGVTPLTSGAVGG